MSFAVSHNPFATRFMRPGAVPFLFDEVANLDAEARLDAVVDAFKEHRWCGQIVGPHGCGKSTLCFSMVDQLRTEFGSFKSVTIRSAKDVQINGQEGGRGDRGRVLTIVDGLERLSWLQQQMMIAHLQKPKSSTNPRSGLLVTSHRPLKFLPVLLRIKPSVRKFKRVVRFLDPKGAIEEQELDRIYEETDGNIREALMACYDRHTSVEP